MPAPENSSYSFPIDAVYLWVNGADPVWREKRRTCLEKLRAEGRADIPTVSLAEGRFSDNGELRYSLRALARFAPWVNRVHIVTDNQCPDWLNTDKASLVDHREILPSQAARPVFSNRPLEFCLHRIPGLAEHYLDFNDDFMLGRRVEPGDFFTSDGRPLIWAYRQRKRKIEDLIWHSGEGLDTHKNSARKAYSLILARTGRLLPYKLKHYPRAVTRSGLAALLDFAPDEVAATLRSPFRSGNDISLYPLYALFMLATGRGELKNLGGCRAWLDHLRLRPVFAGASLGDANFAAKLARIRLLRPLTFCLNDDVHAGLERRKILRDFLDSLYPAKSPFEK